MAASNKRVPSRETRESILTKIADKVFKIMELLKAMAR